MVSNYILSRAALILLNNCLVFIYFFALYAFNNYICLKVLTIKMYSQARQSFCKELYLGLVLKFETFIYKDQDS